MSIDIFSSVSAEELETVVSNKLFRSVLDTMPNGVQVLKAIRNKKNEIKDFVYVFVNEAAENYVGKEVSDKKFLADFPPLNSHQLFEKFITVVNTGNTEDLVYHYNYNQLNRWLHFTIKKFADGVMITHEDITEQEEAKNEIEQQKEKYQSLVENTPDVVTRWNKNLQLIYANAAFEEKTGMSLSQLMGKTNKQMGQPDYVAYPYMEKLQFTFSTGEPQEHFNSYPTPHGEAYFYSRIVPEKNANGEVETVLGIARDITQIKNAEQEIGSNRAFLQSLIDSSLDIIQVFKPARDKDGKIVDFTWVMNNKKAIEQSDEVIGKSVLLQNPGMVDTGIFDRMVQVMETGVPQEHEQYYHHEQFDGWFYQAIVKTGDKVLMTTRDISEQKKHENHQAEEQLKQFNALLEQQVADRTKELEEQSHFISQVTETVPDMISVMELPSRKVTYVNKEIFIAHGFDPRAMIRLSNETLREMIHPDDHATLENYYGHFLTAADDEIVTAEYRAKNLLEKWLWFRVRGVVFQRDDSGKATRILNVIQNITEQKEAEEKINELNKTLLQKNRELESVNSELKTFNAVAANDYRENLRNMYTNLEFIIKKDSRHISDIGKANLRRAQTAIQKMKLLTEDIVAFSRIKALEQDISEVDLNELLKTALNDLNDKILESRAKIEHDEFPVIKGYPSLLSLLFYHLLDNAIKFRNNDTKLTIAIKYTRWFEGFNTRNVYNEWYHKISVIDNGMGLEQKSAEKIFTMFYRLPQQIKYKGSGIGLAICKKIMDLHDGFIIAESDVGKGAAFHCLFPTEN